MKAIDYFRKEIELHIKRVDAVLPEIKTWLPLDKDAFEDIEKVKSIDSFIYRFSKIQDKIGDKLFPEILKELQEYRDNMSLRDVLNRLEKLELIPSTDEWISFRELRNIATHEYPDNEKEVVDAINSILSAYDKIKSIYVNIIDRV
jgi:hypothetical protein